MLQFVVFLFQSQERCEECSACNLGQYQNLTGQTDCMDCMPGIHVLDCCYSNLLDCFLLQAHSVTPLAMKFVYLVVMDPYASTKCFSKCMCKSNIIKLFLLAPLDVLTVLTVQLAQHLWMD